VSAFSPRIYSVAFQIPVFTFLCSTIPLNCTSWAWSCKSSIIEANLVSSWNLFISNNIICCTVDECNLVNAVCRLFWWYCSEFCTSRIVWPLIIQNFCCCIPEPYLLIPKLNVLVNFSPVMYISHFNIIWKSVSFVDCVSNIINRHFEMAVSWIPPSFLVRMC